jgi:hypothetical protein
MIKKSKPINTKNLFVVYYTVKGACWVGSYLVKAKDKIAALTAIKQLDRDHVSGGIPIRLKAYTLKEDASYQLSDQRGKKHWVATLAKLAKSAGSDGLIRLASVAGAGEHWSSRLAR